jgi:hypothetical protein
MLTAMAIAAGLLFIPTTSEASPSCSGTSRLRAALVVDTGSTVYSYCVALDAQSVTGIHLVELAGQQHGLQYTLGFGGAAVCSLAGVGDPASDCFGSFPLWWGYFHGSCSTGWGLAPTGADSYIVHAGDIEGWSWAVDDAQGNHPSPPASLIGTLCAPPPTSPTPTPTPTPTPLPIPALVLINKVRFDPPGNQLAREFVSIKNFGTSAIDLTGWALRDNGGNVYTFGGFVLGPGSLVKVYSGSGVSTASHLYWMNASPIWNDTMDRAILTDATGTLRDRCAYRGERWVLC